MDLSPILSVLAVCLLVGLARPFPETLLPLLAALLFPEPRPLGAGELSPEKQPYYPISDPKKESLLRGLGWAFRLSLWPAFLLSGLVSDRLGGQQGVILGSLGLAVGLAGLGLSRDYRSALGVVFLTGSALAWLTTTSLALLPLAYEGDRDWFIAAASAGFLLLATASLLGSGLAPWLAARLGTRRSLLLLALLYLLPTLLVGLADNSLVAPPTGNQQAVWTDPRLWLVASALALYWPLEKMLVNGRWLYLQDLGATERSQRWASAAFILAFLGSRAALALIPLSPSVAPWLLWVALFAGGVLLGNLISFFYQMHRLAGPLALLVLLGLCLGLVVPGLFGCAWQALPRDYGTSTGLLLTALMLGELGLAPLGGYLSRSWPGRHKLILAMVLMLILLAPLLVLCVWRD